MLGKGSVDEMLEEQLKNLMRRREKKHSQLCVMRNS